MEFNGGCVVAKPETLQEGVADFAKAVGLSAALAVGAHAAGGKNLNRAASYPGGKVTSEMVSASSNMEDYSKRVREIFEQLMKERPNRDMQMAYDIATSRALAEIATEKAAKKSPKTEALNPIMEDADHADLNIAKTPEEYGKPELERMYSEFRDKYFGGDEGPLPKHMDIGFNRTTNALGQCRIGCRTTKMGPYKKDELTSCDIKLSNAYDMTRKKLAEVLIHEMVHAYFAYLDERGIREQHGDRFRAKAREITSQGDYTITVTNDEPVTLNQGTANRIKKDDTVILTVDEPSSRRNMTGVARVKRADAAWFAHRLEKWMGKPVTMYECDDANFKNQLTLRKGKVSLQVVPTLTIDNLIQEGMLKAADIPERASNPVLVWENPSGWRLCQVDPKYLTRTMQLLGNNTIINPGKWIRIFNANPSFNGWNYPPVKGSVSSIHTSPQEVEKWIDDGSLEVADDLRNQAISSGLFHESVETDAEPMVESVKYVPGHKNSKGESAPWTIVSHETGKILSSHKSKKAAEEHLKQMHIFG